ncbi:MAG: N-formylglutamate amidohydrolase [Gammaproteobacteria bacterium]
MIRWLLTCEHGGNDVPPRWRGRFAGGEPILSGHRGWDRGSLEIFNVLAPRIADAAFPARITRLLVDLNRSPGHRHLFSEYTRGLPATEKQEILDTCYLPWRGAVVDQVEEWYRQHAWVLHVSVHSFTPEFAGRRRNADIGLLYDPGRPLERALSQRWKSALKQTGPEFRIRMNYPYRGTADGFTRWLRLRYPQRYAGVELELNEGTLAADTPAVAATVLASLERLRSDFDPEAAPAG